MLAGPTTVSTAATRPRASNTYLLNGLEIHTGVDMHALVDAGQRICAVLGKSNGSRAAKALLAKA